MSRASEEASETFPFGNWKGTEIDLFPSMATPGSSVNSAFLPILEGS
jgi:hypothetical protein